MNLPLIAIRYCMRKISGNQHTDNVDWTAMLLAFRSLLRRLQDPKSNNMRKQLQSGSIHKKTYVIATTCMSTDSQNNRGPWKIAAEHNMLKILLAAWPVNGLYINDARVQCRF